MALTQEELKALCSEALSPSDTEKKCETVASGKVNMRPTRAFVSAMLAGAFIAFGATYFCIFLADPTMPFAVQRFVGGITFCLGLVLVLCCGAELFTGNSLMIAARVAGKFTWSGLLRNWTVVWVGNLIGSLIAVVLIWKAGVPGMNSGAVAQTMVSVAVGKITPDWFTLFCKGILCNIFVCLAVWIGFASRTIVDKVIGIILPISGFVAAGFEHCVANMFFLPMGLLLNTLGVGTPGAVTLTGVLYNLSAATIGNIVGGGLIALAYWFIYAKKFKNQ